MKQIELYTAKHYNSQLKHIIHTYAANEGKIFLKPQMEGIIKTQ